MFGLISGLIRLLVKISVLASGVGMIIAYANLSDVEGWKRDMSERLMNLSGRQLTVNGAIDFKVSFPPRIIAKDVRLENAPWGSNKEMLKVDTVIAEVDFLPLLVGDVAVPRLRLVGADILIETNANGDSNWDDLNEFETAAGGPASTPFNFPGLPLAGPPAGFGGVSVSGGTVTVSNVTTGTSNSFNLPQTSVDFASGAGDGSSGGQSIGGGATPSGQTSSGSSSESGANQAPKCTC
jgi:uncharacterized protein involved in outer membrane biogenesis